VAEGKDSAPNEGRLSIVSRQAKPSTRARSTRARSTGTRRLANKYRRNEKHKEGPRVVVDMAADLFHAGHVSFLHKIRGLFPTAHITVWLQTDEQILDYKKRQPIIRYEERKVVLEACLLVDSVVAAPDEFTSVALAPFDYICHGDDLTVWSDELKERFYGAATREHKLVTVPYTQGISTTDLIDRCRKRT